MKKIVITSIAMLIIIGCGNSKNKEFRVTDDGNGTKSPRIAKVLVTNYESVDEIDKTSIVYHYNQENLLIEKENLEEPVKTTTYSYNNMKQISKIRWRDDLFIGAKSIFLYGKTLYQKTKLPIVSSNIYTFTFHGRSKTVRIEYEYEYNSEDEATKLISSQNILTGTDMPSRNQEEIGTAILSKKYIYDTNGSIIETIENENESIKYTYNALGKLSSKENNYRRVEYTYDTQGLLVLAKEYEIQESEDKKLLKTKKYIYENKPYYSNPSPDDLDQGQYIFSGIPVNINQNL
ncbi:MAG: hypothetical protein DSZ08_08240 [Sulfurovum sp.]|nr:MAG: hypothetical protein DSZ08_08240 [Sulfurovum sp.]